MLSGLTQLNPHQETSARHLISQSAVLQHGLEPFLQIAGGSQVSSQERIEVPAQILLLESYFWAY